MAVVQLHTASNRPANNAGIRRRRIWAVASGKGGVGKSFISSSLGLALANHGKRVVLVDLDLGGANLHTCLGLPQPRHSLSDFIAARQADINDFVESDGDGSPGLISGAADALEIANLKHFQKQKIIRNLGRIEADYIILDLGAGTSFNTLDFFLLADRGIVSVVPDPTSIENTYRFLKCATVRRLREAPCQTRRLMARVLHQRGDSDRKIRTLASFMQAMRQLHPQHAQLLQGELERQSLHLIVNQVMEPADTELGPSMALACSKYFGQRLHYLGHLNHDRQVMAALRQRKPLMRLFPQSRVAIHLEHMASTLMEMDERSAGT